MSNQKATNLKDYFCRTPLFYELKTFIIHFGIDENNNDDFGMAFMLNFSDNIKFIRWFCKQNINYSNSKKNLLGLRGSGQKDLGVDVCSDEDVLRAIDEFCRITEKDYSFAEKGILKEIRDCFFRLVTKEDTINDHDVKALCVDEKTLRAILVHFGILGKNDNSSLDEQIRAFQWFSRIALRYENEDEENEWKNGSFIEWDQRTFNYYASQLYLLKACRNKEAHNPLSLKNHPRKIVLQYILFTYISLVFLLRKMWETESCRQRLVRGAYKYDYERGNLPCRRYVQGDYEYFFYDGKNKEYGKDEEGVPKFFDDTWKKRNTFDKIEYKVNYLIDTTGKKVRLQYNYPGETEILSQQISIKIVTPDTSPYRGIFGYAVTDNGDDAPHWSSVQPAKEVKTFNLHIRRYKSFVINLQLCNDKGEREDHQLTIKLYHYEGEGSEVVIKIPQSCSVNTPVINDPKDKDSIEEVKNLINLVIQEKYKESDQKKEIENIVAKQFSPLFESLRQFATSSKSDCKSALGVLQSQANLAVTSVLDRLSKGEQNLELIEGDIEALSVAFKDYDHIKEKNAKKEQVRFNCSHFLLWLFPTILVLVSLFLNKWDINLFWLRNRWWVVFVGCLLGGIALWSHYMAHVNVIFGSFVKPWHKWFDMVTALVTLLSAIFLGFRIPHLCAEEFVAQYNFHEHDRRMNEKAVAYFQQYKDNVEEGQDEQARCRLAEYYLKNRMTKEALDVTMKMKDSPGIYREGALYGVAALYQDGLCQDGEHKKEQFLRASDALQAYENTYKDSFPAAYYRLKGLLLSLGHRGENEYGQNIGKALELLKTAARNGDKEAYYYLGYIMSHDLKNWDVNDGIAPPYDLCEAVAHLHQAKDLPKSCLELGNIYADLNMLDSARYYYQMAIDAPFDTLVQLQAKYRFALCQEDMGEAPTYLNELVSRQYPPALLHVAITSKNYDAAITRFNTMLKNYDGYRSFPPVTMLYIAKGDDDKALSTLREARPQGKFDETFIEGIKMLLDNEMTEMNYDSIMAPMRESAKKGCKYADMICCYYDMDRTVENGDSSLARIDDLISISKYIPFADILTSVLLQKVNRPEESLAFATKALRKGHPVGALLYSNAIIAISHNQFQQFEALKDSDWETRIKFLNKANEEAKISFKYAEKSIRIDPRKDYYLWFIEEFLNNSYKNFVEMNHIRSFKEENYKAMLSRQALDVEINKVMKEIDKIIIETDFDNESDYLNRMAFWLDAIRFSKDVNLKCHVLSEIGKAYFEYRNDALLNLTCKLLSNIITCINENSKEEHLEIVSIIFNLLQEKSFKESITRKYQNNAFICDLLSPQSRYNKPGTSIIYNDADTEIKDSKKIDAKELFYESLFKKGSYDFIFIDREYFHSDMPL